MGTFWPSSIRMILLLGQNYQYYYLGNAGPMETFIIWGIYFDRKRYVFSFTANQNCYLYLRIHWRLSTIFKKSNENVRNNVFWYVKVYTFWKFIQYTIYWDKTQMLKKVPLHKKKTFKKCTLFPFASSNSS